MIQCGCLACALWIEVARAYHDGRKLEAAMEAARLVQDGWSSCFWAGRILAQMTEDGWIADGEVQV